MMRAVAVREPGGPEQLELMELPDPAPAADEVLVRVEAAGVNPVDVLFREGYLDSGARPLVMGSDFSGVVQAVGADVADVQVGDEVYGYKRFGNGTYAELAVVPGAWVAPKPASISHVEAAAIPCVGLTAYQAVVDALDVRAGETLLVTAAAGGVGSVAVQVATDRGARVVATASAANKRYVRGLGAEAFVDYRAGDWVQDVRRLYPEGLDTALASVAGETTVRAPGVLRDGGRLVWVSGHKPAPEMERGIAGGYRDGMPSRATLQALAELVDADRLRLEVAEVYPLEAASAAQVRVAEGHVRGKLVIEVGR